MSRRMSVEKSNIKNDFRSRWPSLIENFTWFLVQCRRYFNGDMDRLLVFCVISDRNLSAKNRLEDGKLENSGPDRLHVVTEKPINLQFIADCSGLPRETARRKLQDLTALGWVERDKRGNFSLTAKAAADLAPLKKIGIKYLARMSGIFCSRWTGPESESRVTVGGLHSSRRRSWRRTI